MLLAVAPISLAVAFALVSAALPFAFALVVCDFWTVSQQMSPDFDMAPRVLGGFPRVLFAAGIADLGKRRRPAAFRADSACKTAQKLSVGLACTRYGQGKARFTAKQVAGGARAQLAWHAIDERQVVSLRWCCRDYSPNAPSAALTRNAVAPLPHGSS